MPDVTTAEPVTPPPVTDAFEDAALIFVRAMRIVEDPRSRALDRLSALTTATDAFIELVALSEFMGAHLHSIIEQAMQSSNKEARTTARLLFGKLRLVRGLRIATDLSGVVNKLSGFMNRTERS